MPKVFLSLLLFAGLLLLPGCSNAEAKACEAAEQATIDLLAKRDFHWGRYQSYVRLQEFDKENHYSQAQEAEANRQRVIVNNLNCFTPQQVAEAQTYISKIK